MRTSPSAARAVGAFGVLRQSASRRATTRRILAAVDRWRSDAVRARFGGRDGAAASAGEQLAVIERLRVVLSAVGVRFWLRGGWAVDVLLGAVTWPHADVDAVAWL